MKLEGFFSNIKDVNDAIKQLKQSGFKVSAMENMNKISDVNYKIILEASDNNIENAKKTIKDINGNIDDVNVYKSKIAEDPDLNTAFRILSNRFNDGI